MEFSRDLGTSSSTTDNATGFAINSFVFLDFETSHLYRKYRPKIIELSLIAVNRTGLLNSDVRTTLNFARKENSTFDLSKVSLPRRIDKLTLCVDPRKYTSQTSARMTKLDKRNLDKNKKLPFDEDVISMLKIFLSRQEAPVCLVAHNGMSFDFPILRSELAQLTTGDPLADLYCVDSLRGFRAEFTGWRRVTKKREGNRRERKPRERNPRERKPRERKPRERKPRKRKPRERKPRERKPRERKIKQESTGMHGPEPINLSLKRKLPDCNNSPGVAFQQSQKRESGDSYHGAHGCGGLLPRLDTDQSADVKISSDKSCDVGSYPSPSVSGATVQESTGTMPRSYSSSHNLLTSYPLLSHSTQPLNPHTDQLKEKTPKSPHSQSAANDTNQWNVASPPSSPPQQLLKNANSEPCHTAGHSKISYSLVNIFKRTFDTKPPNSHSAEGDVVSLIKVLLPRMSEFVSWADKYATPFKNCRLYYNPECQIQNTDLSLSLNGC